MLSKLSKFFKKQKKFFPDSVVKEEAMKWFKEREGEFQKVLSNMKGHFDETLTMVDVGANVGFYTNQYLKAFPEAGDCYLFEPVPNLFEICRDVHSSNKKVHVFNFALSDEDSSATLYLAQDGNIGWNTLIQTDQAHRMKALDIQTQKFESLSVPGKLGLIKIDVEGGEYKVLRGMLNRIEKDRPFIVCEIAWGPTHPHWTQSLEVFSELGRMGYQSYSVDWNRISVEDISYTQDVFFTTEKVEWKK